MEIERKYLIFNLPDGWQSHPCRHIEQGYLCTQPVVRVRRDDREYYLTYKSSGLLEREEYSLPLTEEAYLHLIQKADGNILSKKRYLIPLEGGLTAELDIFQGAFQGLVTAEVEFETRPAAESFVPPPWFGEDVTLTGEYQNSVLSRMGEEEIRALIMSRRSRGDTAERLPT